MGRATTKDVSSIKKTVNQPIKAQNTQKEMCMDVSHSAYLLCFKVIFSKTELILT